MTLRCVSVFNDTIRLSSNPKNATIVNKQFGFPDWDDFGVDFPAPYSDLVVKKIRDLEFVSPSYTSLNHLCGSEPGEWYPTDTHQMVGMNPIPNDMSVFERVRISSSRIIAIKQILQGAIDGSVFDPLTKVANQHQLYHTNIVGAVYDRSNVHLHRPYTPEQFPGGVWSDSSVFQKPITAIRVVGSQGSYSLDYGETTILSDNLPKYYATNYLPTLKAEVNSGSYNGHVNESYTEFSDFEFSTSGESVDSISYRIYQRVTPSFTNEVWDRYYVVSHLPFFTFPGYQTPLDEEGDILWFATAAPFFWVTKWQLLSEVRWTVDGSEWTEISRVGPKSYIWISSSTRSYLYSHGLFPYDGSNLINFMRSSVNSYESQGVHKNALTEFGLLVQPLLRDLCPGIIFSSKDMLEKSLPKIEANMLETLSDLRDLKDILTPIADFAALVKAAKSGDIMGTFKALLSTLADAHLTYKFVIRPTASDVSNINQKAGAFLRHYDSHFWERYFTAYGSFKWELPEGELPYETTEVTYTSLMRARISPCSLMTALLPVRAFGLLPDLQNLWDLLPMSFVVDWGFDIGDRLATVDAGALLALFETKYTTHSMQINSHMNEDWLETWNLSGFPTKQTIRPAFRQQCRTVLAVPALYGKTRFDFQSTPTTPWATISSLVWKFLD